MRVAYTLDACVDCVAYVANGDIPEDRPELPDDIAEFIGKPGHVRGLVNAEGRGRDGKYLVSGDGKEIDLDHPGYECAREDWFSWSGCECCGSSLGGSRNRLAVLVADEKKSPR